MLREDIKIHEEMEVICDDKIDLFLLPIFLSIYRTTYQKKGEQAVDILVEQINVNNDLKQFAFDSEIKTFFEIFQ